jgi:hypothetical protein
MLRFLCLALALCARAAAAGEHRTTLPDSPERARYAAECGSCHIAYPPQMFSATGWRRTLAELDRHFGTDASVDASAAAGIGAYLSAHAGSERKSGAAARRITETSWFRHEHDEFADARWKSAAVRSAANSEACHTGAAQGDFSEGDSRHARRSR